MFLNYSRTWIALRSTVTGVFETVQNVAIAFPVTHWLTFEMATPDVSVLRADSRAEKEKIIFRQTASESQFLLSKLSAVDQQLVTAGAQKNENFNEEKKETTLHCSRTAFSSCIQPAWNCYKPLSLNSDPLCGTGNRAPENANRPWTVFDKEAPWAIRIQMDVGSPCSVKQWIFLAAQMTQSSRLLIPSWIGLLRFIFWFSRWKCTDVAITNTETPTVVYHLTMNHSELWKQHKVTPVLHQVSLEVTFLEIVIQARKTAFHFSFKAQKQNQNFRNCFHVFLQIQNKYHSLVLRGYSTRAVGASTTR